MKKVWSIPVCYKADDFINVKAESLIDALKYVDEHKKELVNERTPSFVPHNVEIDFERLIASNDDDGSEIPPNSRRKFKEI